MLEYITLKHHPIGGQFRELSARFPLAGAEIYCADLVDRETDLYQTPEELQALAETLKAQGVCRLHASYWASPAAFLCGADDVESLFDGKAGVAEYYSDLTGHHLYRRWCQEYALACAIGAQAYTFHLIDYFPIDGLWRFNISRETVVSAMTAMTAKLLKDLTQQGLLTADSPRIELENAGWGLEYGVQTAEDFAALFRQVEDPLGKLCVAWDTNHLLHAIGLRDGQGAFFLPEEEITPAMAALQTEYGAAPAAFAVQWVKRNLLAEELAGKVACVQLSDCALKEHQFFTQGWLEYPWRSHLEACADRSEMEHLGEQLVLTHYDSHLPLGQGILPGGQVWEMLCRLAEQRPDFVLLHELKNSADLAADLALQRSSLKQGGL